MSLRPDEWTASAVEFSAGWEALTPETFVPGRVARPSTSLDKILISDFASRVGLTPSPTCQTWARWFPQGDAATSATKQVARMSALLGKPEEGFSCPSVSRMAEWRGQSRQKSTAGGRT